MTNCVACSAYCSDRIGVAKLTKMAFDGFNLRPLWHELMAKATDDAQGAGIGMDLSVIAQLLGDQATGLAIQKEVLGYQRLFRSPCATPAPAFARSGAGGGNGHRRQHADRVPARRHRHRADHALCCPRAILAGSASGSRLGDRGCTR
jgi:hypothetical protein